MVLVVNGDFLLAVVDGAAGRSQPDQEAPERSWEIRAGHPGEPYQRGVVALGLRPAAAGRGVFHGKRVAHRAFAIGQALALRRAGAYLPYLSGANPEIRIHSDRKSTPLH